MYETNEIDIEYFAQMGNYIDEYCNFFIFGGLTSKIHNDDRFIQYAGDFDNSMMEWYASGISVVSSLGRCEFGKTAGNFLGNEIQ